MAYCQGSQLGVAAAGKELAENSDLAATFAAQQSKATDESATANLTAYWAARAAGKAALVAAAAADAILAKGDSDERTSKAAKSAGKAVPIAAVAAMAGAIPIAAVVAIAGTAKAASAARARSAAYNASLAAAEEACDGAACAARAYSGFVSFDEPDPVFLAAAHEDIKSLTELAKTSDSLTIRIPLWPNGEPDWYTKLVNQV